MTIIPLADYKASRSIQHCIKADQVVHLPVAPQPVARIRFSAITPERAQCLHMNDALDFLDKFMVEHQDKVGMVAITGPGDPLATPEITLETVKAIRSRYPQVKIGIKTHGIGSDKLAGELARAGVDYVEMEVNGVRAEILDKLYAWIRPGQKTIKIAEAVKLLLREQRNGVPAVKFHNISVSILTTLYPGYNLEHVPRISADMLELGADGIALVPYSPEPAAEVTIDIPTREDIDKITEKAQKYLPIFHPLLVQSDLNAALTLLSSGKPALPKPSSERPNVAVASHNGIDINLHLGQTKQFLIYGRREDGLACLLGSREAPPAGQGDNRWLELAQVLHDCFAILTASAGETPQRVLGEAGIKVMICEDNIDGIVDVLYGGGKKKKKDK